MSAIPANSAPRAQLTMLLPPERFATMQRWNHPTGYTVRLFQPNDETEYIRLMTGAGFTAWTGERVAGLLKQVLPNGFYVIEHDASRRLVATATAQHGPTDFHPYGGQLGWVAGDAEHRGRKLGRTVCAAATQRLIDVGYTRIYLLTDDWRLPAIKVYLDLGFAPLLHMADMEERWRKVCADLKGNFDSTKAIRMPFIAPKPPLRKTEWELILKREPEAAPAETPLIHLSFGLCEPHGSIDIDRIDESPSETRVLFKATGLGIINSKAGNGPPVRMP